MANPHILIVGRLSGPKNDVILAILRNVASKVVQHFPKARFQVVGGPVTAEHLELEKKVPYITFSGHQKDLKTLYRKATVVIGAGRVALEAMALKKPVMAIGERLYVGPIIPENIDQAKDTNFGDCWDEEVFDWAQMAKDVTTLLKDKRLRDKAAKAGYELVQAEYTMDKVFPQVEALYSRVLLQKNLSNIHELPILMYHRVVERDRVYSKNNLNISREEMERQLEFLKTRGFETITFEDLLTRKIPAKPIILTFDDGYEDNYHHLLPLLKKHQMRAVLYLLGNRKHRNNFWDIPYGEAEALLLKGPQIKEMLKSGLVEFGAHSMNHSDLTKLSPSQVEREVAGSKKVLEAFLGRPVVSFAYPYGFLNAEAKKATKAAGYTFGVAVNDGPTRFGGDLMEIRRIHMFPHTSLFKYWKKTSGWYLRYRIFLGK